MTAQNKFDHFTDAGVAIIASTPDGCWGWSFYGNVEQGQEPTAALAVNAAEQAAQRIMDHARAVVRALDF